MPPLNLSPWELFMVAGLPAIGDIASASIASRGAGNAADAQYQSTQDARNAALQAQREQVDLYRRIYEHQANLMQPQVDRGNAAGNELSRLMGLNVQQSPPVSLQSLGPTGGQAPSFTPNNVQNSGAQRPGAGPGVGSTLMGLGMSAAPFLPGLFSGGGAGAASVAAPLVRMGAHPLGAGVVGGATTGGGAAAGGGGFMSTLGSLATNPFTLAGAGALAGGLLWKRSQAHPYANDIVKGREGAAGQEDFDAFLSQVGQAVDSGQISVGQGIQAVEQGWQNYQNTNKQWAGGSGDRNLVTRQSLQTLGPQVQGLIRDWRGAIQTQGGGQDFRVGAR